MTKMDFLMLLHMKSIPAEEFDNAINAFDVVLVDSGLFKKYGHLNPCSLKYEDGDFLTPLSKKWDSLEWMFYMNWLDVVIMSVARECGFVGVIRYESFLFSEKKKRN